MAETNIEWADYTFNAWWGCTKISPACDNCYAETLARRVGERNLWGSDARRRLFGLKHWGEPLKWDAKARKDGKRFRVFCNSMADVFDNHAEVSEARAMLWDLIRRTPRLDWLVLTKRIGNFKFMQPADWHDGYPNVWLGISVVNQEEADRDIPKLCAIPAARRFLSCEPLLGPISLEHSMELATGPDFDCSDYRDLLDWVIVGGESGPGSRPMEVDWANRIAAWCDHRRVAFFMKQGSQANWPTFKKFETFPAKLRIRKWPESPA